MEPITTRELVAWVLVLGLLVTLASSKRRTPKSSSKLAPTQPTSLQKPSALERKSMSFEQVTPKIFGKKVKFNVKKKQPTADPEGFLKDDPSKNWLDKEKPTQKSRSNARKVASLPKPDRQKRSGRRRPDQVSGSQDRPARVRNRSTVKRHGSASHKGPKRSS